MGNDKAVAPAVIIAQTTPTQVNELLAKNFKATIANSPLPCVVEFYKPGCGMCERMEPIIKESLVKNTGKFAFFKLNTNTDNDNDLDRLWLKCFGDGASIKTPKFIFFNKNDQAMIKNEDSGIMGTMTKDIISERSTAGGFMEAQAFEEYLTKQSK